MKLLPIFLLLFTFYSNAQPVVENTATRTSDSLILSNLNKQFIDNFIHQDTVRHTHLIDQDFICIESDGRIVPRAAYMQEWATAYSKSGYTTFSYTDENIRFFGNTALIRSKTVYTKQIHNKSIQGSSIYTDTYVKRNGAWKCIQAQITPLR